MDCIDPPPARQIERAASFTSSAIKFKKMDMIKTDFKDKTFDGIWAAASLIHNDKKNVPKILEELKRVLKDENTKNML